MKTTSAILQVADQGPVESLIVMLNAIGIRCYLPTDGLLGELRSIGCDTVLSPQELTKNMGYDPILDIPKIDSPNFNVENTPIFVDVKAHRNGPKIERRWPALKGRVVWYRINGGMPEHVVNARGDHGDEINPPCPIITPNQWYKEGALKDTLIPLTNKAYTCYPPFYRIVDYNHDRVATKLNNKLFQPPICLIHNLTGWGYGALVDSFRDKFGVLCYGAGSPDGLIPHSRVPTRLSSALCMIHLKSNDAPGYALYEALAAACPIICTRRLIWRCRMEELLIPNETCLVFDRETHDSLTLEDVISCEKEVEGHLNRLRDYNENMRIGRNGRTKLKEVMWSEQKDSDLSSFKRFVERYFG